MSDDLNQRSRLYAERYHVRLTERLGFRIHGIVHVVESNAKPGRTAIKVHREMDPFLRECLVYERLSAARVTSIMDFHVPERLRIDDELRVLEMTIVTRPFLLDFAGAYLDFKPSFPDEVWADWEAEKHEQFGGQWRTVQTVLESLAELDIYMVDVSPSNIAFRS